MQAQGALQAKLGREPTLDEIAAEIDVDAENVYLAMESTYDPVSLYDPVYQDSGDGYGYERGEYTLTELVWEDERKMLFGNGMQQTERVVVHS